MTLPLEKVGTILRNKRRDLGHRIEDMVDENISRSTISNAERGLPNVTESMYIYYADKLGLGSSLFGIIAEKEQMEQEANEELKEIENVIAVDPDESLQKLEEIKEKHPIDKRDNLYPFYIYLLGRCAYEKKKWKKAKTYFHEALTLFQGKTDLDRTNLKAACYNELSRVAFFENQLDNALQYNLEGLNVFQKDGERLRYQFHLLLNKSIFFEKLKQPEKALESIEILHSTIENLPNTKNILSIVPLEVIIEMYNMYATILTQLQLYERALDYVYQGIEISENSKSLDDLLLLRTTLGSIYYKQRNLAKAEKYFQMALKLKKKTKKEYLLVFAYAQLSQLYLKVGKFNRSEEILKEAISISERNNDTIHLITCLIALGDCSLQQKRFSEAIEPYRKAEVLLKTSRNDEKKCEVAINLGYCYQKLGDQKLFEKYKNKVFRVKTDMKWGTIKWEETQEVDSIIK